jgi:phasin
LRSHIVTQFPGRKWPSSVRYNERGPANMTTTTNGKTKTAKPTAAPFEAFSFPAASLEIPAAFRDFAEKSVSQARDAYARFQSAGEEATGLAEETFEKARDGALAIGAKAIDAAKSNSDATFALARDIFGAKSVSEVIELQSTFARKQFEAVTAQMKEFQALGEKYVTATSKSVTEKVEKAFSDVVA